MDRVEAALEEYATDKAISAEMVETIVCTGYGITPEALHTSRTPVVIEARQLAFLLMRKESKMSRPAIAKHFGFTDESNVSHNIRRIKGRLDVEVDLKQRVERIRTNLLAAS